MHLTEEFGPKHLLMPLSATKRLRAESCPSPARSCGEPSPGCFQLIQWPGLTPDLQRSPPACPLEQPRGCSGAGRAAGPRRVLGEPFSVTQQLLRPFPPTKFCCFPWSSCLPLSAVPRSPAGRLASCVPSRWLWESGGSPRDTDGLRREMRAGRELRWERLPGLWVPEERCVILRGSKGSLDYRRSFPQPGKWNLPAVEL